VHFVRRNAGETSLRCSGEKLVPQHLLTPMNLVIDGGAAKKSLFSNDFNEWRDFFRRELLLLGSAVPSGLRVD